MVHILDRYDKEFIFWPEKICETQKKVNTDVQNTVDYVEIKICKSIQGDFLKK